jgi:hypothetical protein
VVVETEMVAVEGTELLVFGGESRKLNFFVYKNE